MIISTLSDERYFALVWAVLTDHPRMPYSEDEDEIETYLEQIFAPEDELKRRWRIIFADYAQARLDGDLTVQSLIREMTEEQAAQMLGRFTDNVPSSPARPNSSTTTTNWEQVVLDHFAKIRQLRPTTKTVGVHSANVSGHFTSLVVTGHSASINAYVVDTARISGHSASGSITMPPHRDAEIRGLSCDVRVRNVTWEQFAREIGAV